jgi:broad specificity phosphatase PhoE
MAAASEIVLLRHGETEWSASGRHTSFSDIALTERGRAQARALSVPLARYVFALVLISPARRARDTCALAGLGAAAEVDGDLAEWDYGDYEGRTTPEIRIGDPGWTIFTGDPPGGETASAVGARADRVLARASRAGGAVALFSHGHFLRVLAARWVGLGVADGRRFGLDTATLSVLGHERDQHVLRVWNASAGLGGDGT